MSLPNHFAKCHCFRACIFILSFSSAHLSSQVGEPHCTYKEEQNFLLLDFTPPTPPPFFEDFGSDSRYSLEGLTLKLKLQYFFPPDEKSQVLGKDPDAGKD